MDTATQTFIHPLAAVEPGATLGNGVRIGPFCHVGGKAVLGEHVELISHVSILGSTTLGPDCTVYPNAVLGTPPQNVKHTGGPTTLTIGANCTIRESVTMHAGSDTSRGATTVGDNGFFMACSHVRHECAVGNNVTLANAAMLGGHCEIGDNVTFGAAAASHQFVRVGHDAFVAGMSALVGDLIPYGMALGNRAGLRGINIVGMKRAGMPRADIHQLRNAYRMIFDRARPVSENLAMVAEKFTDSTAVADVLAFMADRGKRFYCVPPLSRGGGDADDDA